MFKVDLELDQIFMQISVKIVAISKTKKKRSRRLIIIYKFIA